MVFLMVFWQIPPLHQSFQSAPQKKKKERNTFLFKWQSPLAVIMTAAQEEVRCCCYGVTKCMYGEGWGGWMGQQNIGPYHGISLFVYRFKLSVNVVFSRKLVFVIVTWNWGSLNLNKVVIQPKSWSFPRTQPKLFLPLDLNKSWPPAFPSWTW